MLLHLHREPGRLQVERSGKAGSELFCEHSSPPTPLSAPQMQRRTSSGSGSALTTAAFFSACLPARLLAFLGAEKVKGDEVQVEHRRVFRGRRVKEVEEPPLLRTPFLFLPLASFSSPLGTSSLPRCPPLESTASPPPPFSTLASDIF